MKIIILSLFFLMLSGCATKTMYHWGDYSSTLYALKKEPTTESRNKHKIELIEIISEANEKNKKIPPGIYFELAMMEAEDGNEIVARKHFSLELELFPESEKYVELALLEMGAK